MPSGNLGGLQEQALFCPLLYAMALATLAILSLLGVTLVVNPGLWAGAISFFAVLAVIGVAVGYRPTPKNCVAPNRSGGGRPHFVGDVWFLQPNRRTCGFLVDSSLQLRGIGD